MTEKGVRIGDTDQAKVTLLVNLTMNEQHRKKQEKELNKMKYLANKYGNDDFCVFGQFAYDVREGEKQTNKEIAHNLHKLGFISEKGQFIHPNLKFLEKVSPQFTSNPF